jgi:Uncharacterised nucleotidyltransferase
MHSKVMLFMMYADTCKDVEIDHLLAGMLRGSGYDEAFASNDVELTHLFHRIDLHGVGPLLALRHGDDDDLPASMADMLRQRLVAREFWEAQHQRIVARAIDALVSVGCQPLLFKGTALAWSHYPRPATRVRGDSDVLVANEDRLTTCNALIDAGFTTPATAGGHILIAEKLYQAEDPTGQKHDIDLHWRLSSSAVLYRLFSHAELHERSVSLPQFAANARRIGDVDALLIACFHRRIHIRGDCYTTLNGVAYPTPDSLIWLLDIDFLVRSLSTTGLQELAHRANEKGLARILEDGLCAARKALGTPLPSSLLADLKRALSCSPADRYLVARPARRLVLNFVHTPGTAQKVQYLQELIFPPAAYMRARFGRDSAMALPLLYGRRALSGLRKLFARGRQMS